MLPQRNVSVAVEASGNLDGGDREVLTSAQFEQLKKQKGKKAGKAGASKPAQEAPIEEVPTETPEPTISPVPEAVET